MKFSALVVALLVVACLSLAWVASWRLEGDLQEKVEEYGLATAANLAGDASHGLLAVEQGDFDQQLSLDILVKQAGELEGAVAVRLKDREDEIIASWDRDDDEVADPPPTADVTEPRTEWRDNRLWVTEPILLVGVRGSHTAGTRVGVAQIGFDKGVLVDPHVQDTTDLLLAAAAGFAVLGVGAGIAFVALLVGPLRRLRVGVEHLAAGDLTVRVPPSSRDEVGELTRAFNKMGDSLQQKERIQSAFGRYVNEYVLEQLKRGPESEQQLKGMEREVTVLFADIRGFTRLSEGMKARSVVALLNEVFQLVSDRIHERGGIIDKFIGDSVMAYFGAPGWEEERDHPQRAVSAAADIMQAIDKRNARNPQLGSNEAAKVEMGIGIHTGTVVVGDIGSDRRTDFTVIGDVVNVAHRLEKLARPGEILVSEAVQRQVRAEATLHFQGERQLSGREEPVHTYAVEFGQGAAPSARNPVVR